MLKIIQLLLYTSFAISGLSQSGCNLFYDSILPSGETNYNHAIDLWKKNLENVNSKPRNRMLMALMMWNNQDNKNLKKELIYLTKNHGLKISDIINYGDGSLYHSLDTGKLSLWYDKMTKKYMKVWIVKNYNKLETISRIESIYYIDQHIATILYSNLLNNKTENDSLLLESIFQKVNRENFENLVTLCSKINCLPTSSDYTVATSGVIELILAHNLATATDDLVLTRWNSIWSYLVDAYIKGKIDESFLYIFDNSTPSNPTQLSVFQHARACDPVYVKDNYAYVTLRSGTWCEGFTNQLDLIDITDLTNPVLEKTFNMDNPHGLSIKGDNLYLCEGEFGLKTFDISNPMKLNRNEIDHIKNLHSYDAINIPDSDIIMVIGNDGLYQYNTSNPSRLEEISKIEVRSN